jgi:serine/threonine-protein kinase
VSLDDAPTGVPSSEPVVHPHSPDATARAPFAAAAQSVDDAPTAIPGSGPSAHGSGDSGPLATGEAFGPRYHIIRLLGIGGMGAVYQAFDHELGVAVAIKVIRPSAPSDATAAKELETRFKRELVLARQVTHKYVVRIHDLGEIDGIKYLTMPFVEGETLAHVINRHGPLPIRVSGSRAVVGGLIEAHKAGVVHRDLKPANIMISGDDEAMIMTSASHDRRGLHRRPDARRQHDCEQPQSLNACPRCHILAQ